MHQPVGWLRLEELVTKWLLTNFDQMIVNLVSNP